MLAGEDVRGYVIEHLGDPGAVLVVDQTGDLKKGTATPGVRRQYTGTAGRIENSQVAQRLGHLRIPAGVQIRDSEVGNFPAQDVLCLARAFATTAREGVRRALHRTEFHVY